MTDEELKGKIPFLRQWLNERSKSAQLVTNEDLGYFLGLNTAEEAQEARKKEMIDETIKLHEWAGSVCVCGHEASRHYPKNETDSRNIHGAYHGRCRHCSCELFYMDDKNI